MHFLLSSALVVSPASTPQSASPSPDIEASPSDSTAAAYSTATLELRESIKRINVEPEVGIAPLLASLAAVEAHPELLAHDPPTQALRRSGQLAWARAELARGNHDSATEAIDRALLDFELAGELESVDPAQLGPSLRDLFDARRQAHAAAPRGRLRVSCEIDLRTIVVEGREVAVAQGTGPGLLLPRGAYVVVTVTATGSLAHDVVLGEAPVTTLACADTPEPAPAHTEPVDSPPRHVAPRGLSAGLVAAGSVGAGTGALLLGLDGRCQNGGSNATCPMVFETDRAGAAVLAVGAAVLVGGVVLLAVDAARRRKHERARVRVGPGIVQF